MLKNDLLKGEKVKLTALKKDDISAITEWHESPEFLRLFTGRPSYPQTISNIEKWFDDVTNAKDSYIFGIRDIVNNGFIGYVVLESVNWSNGFCWIAIAIGDSSNQNRGYGKEAMALAIDFAFRELNLHRIQLTVFSYNTRAISLYESLGFKKEGAFREFIHRDGKRYDMFLYGLLRHEWQGKVGK